MRKLGNIGLNKAEVYVYKENRGPMQQDDRTIADKVSDAIAKFGGSWRFIFIAVALGTAWIIFNTLIFFDYFAWDRYPFILLNLCLSFVAAFQAPFILMSQRRCEIKQDIAYRNLFAEIKELIQTDLEVEQKLFESIMELKNIVKQLQKNDEILEEMVEQVEEMVEEHLEES